MNSSSGIVEGPPAPSPPPVVTLAERVLFLNHKFLTLPTDFLEETKQIELERPDLLSASPAEGQERLEELRKHYLSTVHKCYPFLNADKLEHLTNTWQSSSTKGAVGGLVLALGAINDPTTPLPSLACFESNPTETEKERDDSKRLKRYVPGYHYYSKSLKTIRKAAALGCHSAYVIEGLILAGLYMNQLGRTYVACCLWKEASNWCLIEARTVKGDPTSPVRMKLNIYAVTLWYLEVRHEERFRFGRSEIFTVAVSCPIPLGHPYDTWKSFLGIIDGLHNAQSKKPAVSLFKRWRELATNTAGARVFFADVAIFQWDMDCAYARIMLTLSFVDSLNSQTFYDGFDPENLNNCVTAAREIINAYLNMPKILDAVAVGHTKFYCVMLLFLMYYSRFKELIAVEDLKQDLEKVQNFFLSYHHTSPIFAHHFKAIKEMQNKAASDSL